MMAARKDTRILELELSIDCEREVYKYWRDKPGVTFTISGTILSPSTIARMSIPIDSPAPADTPHQTAQEQGWNDGGVIRGGRAMGNCKWHFPESLFCNDWVSGCGYEFYLDTVTPEDASMRYCPFCGKLLVLVSPEESPTQVGGQFQ